MSKPEDIPPEVWDEAFKAMPPVNQEAYDKSPFAMVLHLGFARAILAAEKRGEEREREACAQVADDAQAYLDAEYAANPTDGPFAVQGGSLTSKHIASAIRARSTP